MSNTPAHESLTVKGRLIALFIGIFLTLFAGEVILRLMLDNKYYVYPPHHRRESHPSPEIMPGVQGKATFLTNSDGIRGDEMSPQHTYRILAVGGSTTQCSYLDQAESWPYRLQQLLNKEFGHDHRIWVGNSGKSGHDTRDHIVQLEYILPQHNEIDTVILLVGANDIGRRLGEDKEYDPNALNRPDTRREILARAFYNYPLYSISEGIKGTAIWGLMRRAKVFQTLRSKIRNMTEDTGGQIYQQRRMYRAKASLTLDHLPDLSTGLDEYTRNLGELARIARRHSVRVIFMTQPSMYRPDLSEEYCKLLWLGGVGNYFYTEPGHAYYSVQAMAEAYIAYNKALLQFCEQQRLECIDLASRVPKDTRAFYDDAHFNETGAEIVSKIVFDYLRARPPFTAMMKQRPME